MENTTSPDRYNVKIKRLSFWAGIGVGATSVVILVLGGMALVGRAINTQTLRECITICDQPGALLPETTACLTACRDDEGE
jgi:hypothetical protein